MRRPALYWTVRKDYTDAFSVMRVTSVLTHRVSGSINDHGTFCHPSECMGKFHTEEEAEAACVAFASAWRGYDDIVRNKRLELNHVVGERLQFLIETVQRVTANASQ